MGVFDEGCMGMYNAIIPDEILNHGRLQGAPQPVGPIRRHDQSADAEAAGDPQMAG